MKLGYINLLIVGIFLNCEGVVSPKEQQKARVVQKKGNKKQNKKTKKEQKREITPYEVAENISKAINWLSDSRNSLLMADAEPKILKRRRIAVNLYKAEGFCLISLAQHVFPSTKEKDIEKLLNWPDLHPLLGKDVYAEIQKFADINFDYHNDTSLKAPQSEIVRDKLREGLHENIFSIIDLLDKLTNTLPNSFYYSGHPYEGIAAFDHVLLYELLSVNKKTSLSPGESCFHLWQVALYKNFYYMAKLIADRILSHNLDPDTRDLIKQIAVREPGDDNLALPTCGL